MRAPASNPLSYAASPHAGSATPPETTPHARSATPRSLPQRVNPGRDANSGADHRISGARHVRTAFRRDPPAAQPGVRDGLPAPSAARIAGRLHAAMRPGIWGLGTRETILLQDLAGLSKSALDAVREAYRAHFGRSLDQDIRGELRALDREQADTLLAGRAWAADAVVIHQATRTLHKCPSRVFRVLEKAAAQPGGVQQLAKAYRDVFDGRLRERLQGCLKEAQRPRALALLDGDKAAADAHLLATTLRKKRSPQRDGLLFSLLRRYGPRAAQELERATGLSLRAHIENNASGLSQTAALALVDGDERRYTATRLRQVVQGEAEGTALVVLLDALTGLSPDAKQALQDEYTRQFGSSLAKDLAQLSPPGLAHAAGSLWQNGDLAPVEILRTLEDEPEALIAFASQRSHAEMARLLATYQTRYGETLHSVAKSHIKDGALRLRLEHALQGRPSNIEAAVERVLAEHALLREGSANTPNRLVLDWMLFSPKGKLVDNTAAALEAALDEAKRDGVIDDDEHAELGALVAYTQAELESYHQAQTRLADGARSMLGAAAASAAIFLTQGVGSPLAVQLMAAGCAGSAGRAVGGAAAQGKTYTRAQLGVDLLDGAAHGLGATVAAAATEVGTATGLLSPEAWSRALARKGSRRLGYELLAYASRPDLWSRIGQSALQSAVRGATASTTRQLAHATRQPETWQEGAAESARTLASALGEGIVFGAAGGMAAGLTAFGLDETLDWSSWIGPE